MGLYREHNEEKRAVTMKFHEASAKINATPQQVWEVLTDGAGFTTWDSGIEKFEGTIALGEKIKLYSEVSPGRAFPLTVTAFEPGRMLVFKGGMPLGLFTGVRTYKMRESDGATDFKMREEFRGPLLPMIWKSMPDLGPSFQKFAQGLKNRVEGGAG